jgi:hypothetical protein
LTRLLALVGLTLLRARHLLLLLHALEHHLRARNQERGKAKEDGLGLGKDKLEHTRETVLHNRCTVSAQFLHSFCAISAQFLRNRCAIAAPAGSPAPFRSSSEISRCKRLPW